MVEFTPRLQNKRTHQPQDIRHDQYNVVSNTQQPVLTNIGYATSSDPPHIQGEWISRVKSTISNREKWAN